MDFHDNTTLENLDVMMRIEDVSVIKKFYKPYYSEKFDETLSLEGYLLCERVKKNNLLNCQKIIIIDLDSNILPKGLTSIVRDFKISLLLE